MIEDYFQKTVSYERPFFASSKENPNLIVVIPAYAEKAHLFKTLSSLAENPAKDLEHTLVLCVINNESSADSQTRENNAQTMRYLHALIRRENVSTLSAADDLKEALLHLSRSPLRIGYIDASSAGHEIPDRDKGAGTARKIGMDMALRLLWPSCGKKGIIASLDADTQVLPNYLASLRDAHSGADEEAFVIDYAHALPSDPFLAEAICNYEIFLRYYVLGLALAGSPYAYHVMGSAMAVTAGAYLAVRGMNRRAAGEDFYFLNKIAKVCSVKRIRSTQVLPAARVSNRVPFGTGASMRKSVGKGETTWRVYHPEVFIILSQWLNGVKRIIFHGGGTTEEIMTKAEAIHPVLFNFLTERKFPRAWERICFHAQDPRLKIRRFHEWFDAFQTLKFIREMHRAVYPMIRIEEAWPMVAHEIAFRFDLPGEVIPEGRDAFKLLNFLRRW